LFVNKKILYVYIIYLCIVKNNKMGDNEKDSETLDDSTSRTIKLTNSAGYTIFSETHPSTQGTPQK
jgi:hypothetical protein